MAKLPTEEELEQLYHDKGHDALVWYTWRNILRVFPLLGKESLDESSDIKHIYTIFRYLFVISQWESSKKGFSPDVISSAVDGFVSNSCSKVMEDVLYAIYAASVVSIEKGGTVVAEAAAMIHITEIAQHPTLASCAESDYRFLLETDKTPKNYWFSENLFSDTQKNTMGFLLLRYDTPYVSG